MKRHKYSNIVFVVIFLSFICNFAFAQQKGQKNTIAEKNLNHPFTVKLIDTTTIQRILISDEAKNDFSLFKIILNDDALNKLNAQLNAMNISGLTNMYIQINTVKLPIVEIKAGNSKNEIVSKTLQRAKDEIMQQTKHLFQNKYTPANEENAAILNITACLVYYTDTKDTASYLKFYTNLATGTGLRDAMSVINNLINATDVKYYFSTDFASALQQYVNICKTEFYRTYEAFLKAQYPFYTKNQIFQPLIDGDPFMLRRLYKLDSMIEMNKEWYKKFMELQSPQILVTFFPDTFEFRKNIYLQSGAVIALHDSNRVHLTYLPSKKYLPFLTGFMNDIALQGFSALKLQRTASLNDALKKIKGNQAIQAGMQTPTTDTIFKIYIPLAPTYNWKQPVTLFSNFGSINSVCNELIFDKAFDQLIKKKILKDGITNAFMIQKVNSYPVEFYHFLYNYKKFFGKDELEAKTINDFCSYYKFETLDFFFDNSKEIFKQGLFNIIQNARQMPDKENVFGSGIMANPQTMWLVKNKNKVFDYFDTVTDIKLKAQLLTDLGKNPALLDSLIQRPALTGSYIIAAKHEGLRNNIFVLGNILKILNNGRNIDKATLRAEFSRSLGDVMNATDDSGRAFIFHRLQQPYVNLEYFNNICYRINFYPDLRRDILAQYQWFATFDDMCYDICIFSEQYFQNEIPGSSPLAKWKDALWWSDLRDKAIEYEDKVVNKTMNNLFSMLNVLRSVTLEITDTSGQVMHLFVDNLAFDKPNNQYIIADAKYSLQKIDWKKQWADYCTPSQLQAYQWLQKNIIKTVVIKSFDAQKNGAMPKGDLIAGKEIPLKKTNFRIYGSAAAQLGIGGLVNVK